MKHFKTITGLAALAAAALMSLGPASAQEGIFFKNLLGSLGVIDDPDREPIDYRSRAPLVVPPSFALPDPQAPAATRNAAWPTDPDVVRRKRATAAANAPAPMPQAANNAEGAALRGAEMNRLNGNSVLSAPGPREHYGDGRLTNWVDPKELRKGTATAAPKVAYGQEPDRGSLVQPPAGYRMPADNAPIAKTRDKPVLNPVNDENPERTAGKERVDD